MGTGGEQTAGPVTAATPGGERPVHATQRRFERALTASRLLALVPVVFLLLDAAASFVYGTDIFVRTATDVFSEPAKIGGRLGIFLIVMDTFLVGATLMIAAFGFYELFVIRDERTSNKFWLPTWLRSHDLDDLKARVVSMLILVAAITFVDRLVESRNEQAVLFLGSGISIIIAGLTAFLFFGKRKPPPARLGDVSGGNGSPEGSGPESGGALPGGLPRGATRDVPGRDLPGREPTDSYETTAAVADSARQVEEPPRPARVMAILAGTRRVGNWNVARRTKLIAAAGWAQLDLREAVLPAQQIAVRVIAGLGVVSITVPPHMDVSESGTTLLGLRSIHGGPATQPRVAAPELLLSGACVLGVIRVRRIP